MCVVWLMEAERLRGSDQLMAGCFVGSRCPERNGKGGGGEDVCWLGGYATRLFFLFVHHRNASRLAYRGSDPMALAVVL